MLIIIIWTLLLCEQRDTMMSGYSISEEEVVPMALISLTMRPNGEMALIASGGEIASVRIILGIINSGNPHLR